MAFTDLTNEEIGALVRRATDGDGQQEFLATLPDSIDSASPPQMEAWGSALSQAGMWLQTEAERRRNDARTSAIMALRPAVPS